VGYPSNYFPPIFNYRALLGILFLSFKMFKITVYYFNLKSLNYSFNLALFKVTIFIVPIHIPCSCFSRISGSHGSEYVLVLALFI
jgi:hypothetical protein